MHPIICLGLGNRILPLPEAQGTAPSPGLTPCCGLIVCVLPNSYAELLIPSVMALGDAVFGRWLGIDETMRVGPMMGLVPLREEEETSELLSAPGGRKEPCTNQKKGSHWELNLQFLNHESIRRGV